MDAILSEQVVSIAETPKRIPPMKGGRRVHISTVYRWALRGVRGVVLETIMIGGRRCTSVEAMSRFFERLSNQSREGTESYKRPRKVDRKRVEKELDDARI